MDGNIKLKILKSIGQIYEQAEGCKLESTFLNKIDNELDLLSAYFKTSKNQSFFIAMVFALNYKSNSVDLNDLISYFNCNPMKLLEYSEDIEALCSKGILEKRKVMHGMNLPGSNDEFTINETLSQAILHNQPMPVIRQTKFKDVLELLEKLHSIGEKRDDDEISTGELFSMAGELISANLHFPLVKKVHDFHFKVSDTYLFFHLIWKTLCGNEKTDLGIAAQGIFDSTSRKVNYIQKVISGENILIKNNLIELEEAIFFNDAEIKLSDISLDILDECGIKLFQKKLKKENVIKPSDIQIKGLFFDKEKLRQLNLIKELLMGSKLAEIQNRLTEKKLPKGITVLLHGLPGTGKTEVAMQMAKYTGREIMKVEISQSKSMWFGESEKIIKKIFTDYKSFAKDSERMPILLFNEADAILSKRQEIGNSNIAQTENAIQNILLEELENFEGILIATTNLAKSLDTAFERRFLFKVEFDQPDVEIKSKIWKSKLPYISESECHALATQFDFSGGQIDNIVRKSEIHEVIHGVQIDFNGIIDYCRTEKLEKSRSNIGFSLS